MPPTALAAERLTRGFGFGSTDATTGGEVTLLQRILAEDKSVYPEGIISGYYGKLTETAVQRWQKKNKIISSGTPQTTGYGWVGPKTRESLNAKAAKLPGMSGTLTVKGTNITVPATLSASSKFTNTLSAAYWGAGNGQVAKLTQSSTEKGIKFPASLTCATPCTVENTVIVESGTPPGTYEVKVTAVAGKDSGIGYYTITVGGPERFEYTLTASGTIDMKKSLSGSTSGSNHILIRTVSGEPKPVRLTQKTSIQGLTVKEELGTCTPPCEIRNTVSAGLDMLTGAYSVTVNGDAGGVKRSATYNVYLQYNEDFGFHVSNQQDPDKSITMTRPSSEAVTERIPLKFILDGGTPSMARVTIPKLPEGVSASISGCMLPCDATLSITISPQVTVGSKSVSFSVEADYRDRKTGELKTMKKSYSQNVKVVNGDQLDLP